MSIEITERHLPAPDMPSPQEGAGRHATMDVSYNPRAAGDAGEPRGKELKDQPDAASDAPGTDPQPETTKQPPIKESKDALSAEPDTPVDDQKNADIPRRTEVSQDDDSEPVRTVTATVALNQTIEVGDGISDKDSDPEDEVPEAPPGREPEGDETNQTVVEESAEPQVADDGGHNDGDDGGDIDEREEQRPEPREPIVGIVAEVVEAERMPRYANSLEVPGLRARLNDLSPGEFILVEERTSDSPVGETVRFEDDETMKSGLDLGDGQEARVGVLSTPVNDTAVLLKPFDEEEPYEDEMSGVDSVVLEDGMAKAINDSADLRHRGIRAVEAVGYSKYLSSETGRPICNVAIMTRFEENANTFQHHLWGGEQSPTAEQVEEIVGKAADTIGALHSVGLIHGSPHAGNFLRAEGSDNTIVTDFEGSMTFREVQNRAEDGLKSHLQNDLEIFAEELIEWHHQGRISEQQARELLGHFGDRYRTAAHHRDTQVPRSARLRADEITNIGLHGT